MASLPTFNAGTEPTASQWQTLLPVFVRKLSDQTVTSSTTLVNDTALVTPTLAANTTWDLDMFLIYTAGGAASTNGIKFGFSGPSGAVLDWVPYSKIDTDGTQTAAAVWLIRRSITDTIPSGGSGTTNMCAHIRGVLKLSTTAGVLQFQWAQNTSNATGTVVKGASSMTLRQVA